MTFELMSGASDYGWSPNVKDSRATNLGRWLSIWEPIIRALLKSNLEADRKKMLDLATAMREIMSYMFAQSGTQRGLGGVRLTVLRNLRRKLLKRAGEIAEAYQKKQRAKKSAALVAATVAFTPPANPTMAPAAQPSSGFPLGLAALGAGAVVLFLTLKGH